MLIVPAGRHATMKQRYVMPQKASAQLMQIAQVKTMPVTQRPTFVQRALPALLIPIVSPPGRSALKQMRPASLGWASVQPMGTATASWKNAMRKATSALQSQGFAIMIMTAEPGKTVIWLPKPALQMKEDVQLLRIASSGRAATLRSTIALQTRDSA